MLDEQKAAIIKTEWHEHEGGYWEAQAFQSDGSQMSGVYRTMFEERAAVAGVVKRLIEDGYTHITCRSTEPISCQIVWEAAS